MLPKTLPRMCLWLLVSLILIAFVALLAPYQVPVSLYKLSLITSAGWIAYWLDRSFFPYARPDRFIEWGASLGGPGVALAMTLPQAIAFAAAMLRRALIVAGAMVAAAIGA